MVRVPDNHHMAGVHAEIMIEADRVSRNFGAVQAVDSVSIAVPRGTVLALLGHNGSGKTTLINILTCAIPPSSGRASIAGFDVLAQPREVRKRIGLTGQFASVDGGLSGRENLRLIARLLGADRRSARARADTLLAAFDLEDVATRRANTYSGGLRRRLDIAMSLVGQPEVVFLDEPSSGLDLPSRIMLWDTVEKLVAEGTTVLLTTQHLDEADRLASTITVLSHGVVVASGTPAELKARAGQRRITIKLTTAEQTSTALEWLTRAGLAPQLDRERNTIVLPANAAEAIALVVTVLKQANVEAGELTFSPPSLDDVYLTIAADSSGPAARLNRQPVAQQQGGAHGNA
jgi:ABC-2 type transport system ATP-binding protein